MADYKVRVTEYALNQMMETVQYIKVELDAPVTAKRWLDEMKKQIAGLEFMPERAPLVSEEKWRSQGIRKLTVKNYLVYFRVDDSDRTVWITAVVNSRRSQPEQLEAMPL